jgi:hypothetical protein
MKATKEQLKEWSKDIYAHAEANYEVDGWDYIVECQGKSGIVEMLEESMTFEPCPTSIESYEDAFKDIASTAKLWNEQRSEVQATAW